MKRIAVYAGNSLPPNLIRFISALEKLTTEDIQFVVVGTAIDPTGLPDGIDYFDVRDTEATRGLGRAVATYRRLSTYLDEAPIKPDALWQITTPQFHGIPTLLVARTHRLPVATRVPGDKFNEFRTQGRTVTAVKTYLMNNVGLRAFRYATLVVTLSEHNRHNLTARGVPDRKIRVLRPPLDTDRFAPVAPERATSLRDDLGFDRDAHCVLYVGRLSELKGMSEFQAAVERFEGDRSYEFHFVGTGEFSDVLDAYDNTVLHGFVAPEDVHRYYKAADLLVHPSYIEEEGISWTMIEAAATRLPVVSRDIENAGDVASFVFTTTGELISYLSDPSQWEAATYPTEWSLEHLAPAYNAFFVDLVSDS